MLRRLIAAFGILGPAVLALSLLGAPVQCAAQREPSRTRVTPPADAVYEAAGHLRDQGHPRAHEAMLRYLVERYPATQAAARARDDLDRAADGSGSAPER